jgi:hypothetical protein
VRDLGLPDTALAMPQAQSGGAFLPADIYTMAATYLFHITKNHPFIDGNKRAGAEQAADDPHAPARPPHHPPSTMEWLTTARNYTLSNNQGGFYDEVAAYQRKLMG